MSLSQRTLVRRRRFALVALTERSQVAKSVDAGVVLIGPGELEGVIANLGDVAEHEVAAGHELDVAAVALTMRTRTIAPQDLMRKNALVPIGPLDLHDLGTMRSFDAGGLDFGIVRHARLPSIPCAAGSTRGWRRHAMYEPSERRRRLYSLTRRAT